jgi:hypothetical protein
MGTNYYLYSKEPCPHCEKPILDKSQKLHIGKSSFGWTFSFHGPRQYDMYDFDEGLADQFPDGINCERDWLKAMTGRVIMDEYGDKCSHKEFWSRVEGKRGEKNNHTTYCLESNRPGDRTHGMEQCWLDEQGNSFSKGEFS